MHRFVRLQFLLSVSLIGLLLLLSGQELKVQSSTQSASQPSVNSKPIPQLTPGKPIEQDLKGGEKHTYPIQLKANDYLKLVVEQHGVDVVVRLISPDGKTLHEVDSPNGTQGPEPLSAIIEQGGSYTVEVESLEKTAPSGKYELKLEPLNPATEQDRVQVEIETQSAEVEKLRQAGKYDQALPLAQQTLDKAEKIFGSEHLLVAGRLNTLALIYESKGSYAKAEPLYVKALAVYENELGANHPLVASTLDNMAVLLYRKGEYARAEPLYLRALAIYEKASGSDNLEVVNILNNLAALSYQKGDYARAEPLFLRSLAISEKILGANHPAISNVLNNLAALSYQKGDYARAEPLMVRALAIAETALGPDHPDVAQSLSSLASLYQIKGDYTNAEPLLVRALAIREKSLGADHLSVANSLNNLAGIYQGKGEFAKAEPLYVRALAISEKVLGPSHPIIANLLNNLAVLYMSNREYAKAEPLYVRALAIREKTLGAGHPETAQSLNNLATFYHKGGDYAKAGRLLVRALAITETTLGAEHREVAGSLNSLAAVSEARGDIPQAIQYRIRSNDATERDLVRNLVAGSEFQKSTYLKQTASYTHSTLSLHLQSAPHDLEAAQAGFTVILRRKGRALDAMTDALAILRSQQRPETQKLLDDYTSLVGQISVLTLRGPGTKKPEVHLAEIRSLEDQKEKLENDISRRSGEFKAQTTPITLEAVQKLIPTNAALVEYVVYRPFDAKTGDFGKPQYAAYVLQGIGDRGQGIGIEKQGSGFRVPGSGLKAKRMQSPQDALSGPNSGSKEKDEGQKVEPGTRNPEPGTLALKPGTLSWVDLGDAEPIDQAVAALRQALSSSKKSTVTEVQSVSQTLDKLVMKPVRKLVGSAHHLLISPDGALNLVPFSALVDEKGKFLVEDYTLTYLTSGRDLLRLGVKIESHDPPLVMADPDYKEGNGPQLLGSPLPRLSRLVGARIEGEGIKAIFPKAQLKMKSEATKAILKQAVRPELLHIATHGYFLKDAPPQSTADDLPQAQRSLARVSQDAETQREQRELNPLLRSMLFFAGANQGGSGENDGVM
ncbi:MAG TPA: CHAT domain-containing protein, partial [Acidobacteriota bacterium]|nr:CHAT domain-containing protein [Acidobacteriota bacterium]